MKHSLCILIWWGQNPSFIVTKSAACDSPHKASAAPGLFDSSYLRKVASTCVVRWISRLYSLQYSPWIPGVPFLRLLLAHAFYLCQENIKLNVFSTIAFHLVSLTCSLSFWEIAEQHGSVQYQKCCWRFYRASEIIFEKCFMSHFCWLLSLCVVNQKKPPVTKLVHRFRVEFVTFLQHQLHPSADGWNGR